MTSDLLATVAPFDSLVPILAAEKGRGWRNLERQRANEVLFIQCYRQRGYHGFDELQVPQSFADDAAQLLT